MGAATNGAFAALELILDFNELSKIYIEFH